MKIIQVKDYEEMSKKAAAVLAAKVVSDPECVLGLATGSTPEGAYRFLVEWYEKGLLDFSGITTMNLDEYKGISKENEQSYYYFMKKHLFSKVNIKENQTCIPDGEEEDGEKVCREYEELIQSVHGVDLQLLGIGRNGHIGFNEPCGEFMKRCHCVTLTESTIEANKRFFESEDQVPRQAYTMGIGTIMSADRILLLASGEEKAEALYQAVCGPITPNVPASILQLHDQVTIIADEAAMSKMNYQS